MPKKINIMHVLPSLEIGGMENGVVNLVNNLDDEIFENSICCLESEGPMKNRLFPGKAKVFLMNIKPGIQYGLPFKLAKLFRKENIDIVHTHNFDSGLYGILGAKIGKVPVIVHGEHGSFLQNSPRRNQIGKWVCRKSDYIITMSSNLEEKLKSEWQIVDDKISYILNGLDYNKFAKSDKSDSLKNNLGINPDSIVIGTVGRLVPVKDYATLIDAFALLKKRVQKSQLVFIGDGPLKNNLIEQAKKLGILDSVKMLGTRDDVAELLHIFDVFCLTSLTEGNSNTILEAMAAGLPIVATNVGGTPEIIQSGVNGILVPPRDPNALMEAIHKVITNRTLASQFGTSAQQWVQKERSLERMVQQYMDVYQSLLRKKGLGTAN